MNLYYLILLLMMPGAAGAEPADQPNHRLVLFTEDWSGDYFLSDYRQENKDVIFQVCRDPKNATTHQEAIIDRVRSGCTVVAKVPFDRLETLQPRLIEGLKEYRRETVTEANSGIWGLLRRLPGSAEKSVNERALDSIVAAIESEGLGSWVLMPKGPLKEIPGVSGPAAFSEMAEIFRKSLTNAPEIPDDCPI